MTETVVLHHGREGDVVVTTRCGRLLQRLVGRLALWLLSRSVLEPLHIEEILFAPGGSLVRQQVLARKHGGFLVGEACRNALSPGIGEPTPSMAVMTSIRIGSTPI